VVEREDEAKFGEWEKLRRVLIGGRGSGVGGFENGNQFPLNGLKFMEDIEEEEEEEEEEERRMKGFKDNRLMVKFENVEETGKK
jgi:hypothetical protein